MLKIFNKINWLQYQEILLVLLLIIATVLLNKPVGDSFWRFDDPMILKCAIEYRWWEHFIIPESYQCLSAAHLTPWVTFSYALDYNLFGLEPKFFYYHQIFSLSLVSIFTFVLLRLYVNPLIAFFGILLFLIGSPVWVSSQQLMVRHYVEGLLFSIISIHFFILSLRFQQYRYALLGCLFYILATSAKEIYVPLLGILLFIPEGRLKDRFYAAIPYFIWGAIYIIWRKYMLGVFMGGYNPTMHFLNYFNQDILLNGLNKISSFILMAEYANIILILYFCIIVLILRKHLLLNIIGSLLIIAPLVPLFNTEFIEFRTFFFLWWGFCILIIFSYHHIYTKNISLFIPLGIIFGLFLWKVIDKRIETKKNIKPTLVEFNQQGHFYWNENNQKILFSPHKLIFGGGWYFADLEKIKKKLGLSSPHLYALLNLKFLSDSLLLQNTIWRYNIVCQCMEQVAKEDVKKEIANLNSKTVEKKLSIFVSKTLNTIEWKFAPYNQGTYYIISDRFYMPIPKENTALFYDKKLNFIIVYESPEGWITYSPEFTLEKDQIIDWKRP